MIMPSFAATTPTMMPQWFRVVENRPETHDTFTLSLESATAYQYAGFKAGQFNMLTVWGVGEVPISISSDPTQPTVLWHTIRAVGAVTHALQKLPVGALVGVRGAFGTHWQVEDWYGRDILIVAGGIGLAPLRPAIYQLIADRARYGRIMLLYGTRTPDDLLYQAELAVWQNKHNIEVGITVDNAKADWRGDVGFVTNLLARQNYDRTQVQAVLCGPEIMMRFAASTLFQQGVQPEQIAVSLERNMQCAVGLCGHCQLGPYFVCKDGAVFAYPTVQKWLGVKEL